MTTEHLSAPESPLSTPTFANLAAEASGFVLDHRLTYPPDTSYEWQEEELDRGARIIQALLAEQGAPQCGSTSVRRGVERRCDRRVGHMGWHTSDVETDGTTMSWSNGG